MVKEKNDNPTVKQQPKGLLKFLFAPGVVFAFAAVFAFGIHNNHEKFEFSPQCVEKLGNVSRTLKYWGVAFNNWNPNGNLRTMNRVFDRLGYKTVNGFQGDEWDFLWSVEYPFFAGINNSDLYNRSVIPLKPHQKINHFPGIGFVTDKHWLNTRNQDIKAILPGFRFPYQVSEFKEFVKKNLEARFVVKGLSNRGIKLVNVSDISFEKNEQFYQLFMERPLLIDGHAMDFSNYVVISSIDPLRIYRLDHELYLRFCKEPYYPFDPLNTNKYVVSEIRKELKDIPSISHYMNTFGYSVKQSVEEVFKNMGHNITELWRKVDEAIVKIFLNNEQNILKEVKVHDLKKVS